MNWNRLGFILTSCFFIFIVVTNELDATKSELEFMYLALPVIVVISWFSRTLIGQFYQYIFELIRKMLMFLFQLAKKIWIKSGK